MVVRNLPHLRLAKGPQSNCSSQAEDLFLRRPLLFSPQSPHQPSTPKLAAAHPRRHPLSGVSRNHTISHPAAHLANTWVQLHPSGIKPTANGMNPRAQLKYLLVSRTNISLKVRNASKEQAANRISPPHNLILAPPQLVPFCRRM